MACDLEVQVDGEVFLVNEGILSSFCGKFDALFDETASSKTRRVVLRGFPGGPEVFELLASLCYNCGGIEMTPTNTCVLRFAAHFMGMSGDFPSPPNLVTQTETSLRGISSWTNSELLIALRQCRDYFPISDSCGAFEKVLRSLAERIINSASDGVPSDSSPESSRFRSSFETRSIASTKNSAGGSCVKLHWWLEDLVLFHVGAIEKIIHAMVSRKMDHPVISRFLLYYLKTGCSNSPPDEKAEIAEAVIYLLHSLDSSATSCKGLFEVLRVSSSLNPKKRTRETLDEMIGCMLDQATLDNMLIPAPSGIDTLYDVDQVLRFLKSFLQQKGCSDQTKLRKVGSLMDLYLAEAAPDPGLKPRKFVSLAVALPNAARGTFDGIYRAIDMYIELHRDLSEEEKRMICCTLDYEKLSSEACKHLAQNAKMPSWAVIKALMSQQSRLRGLLRSSNLYNSSRGSPCGKESSFRGRDQTVLYARRVGVSAENEKLKARLEGMQGKVMELQDVCRKMQTQMRSILKTTVVTGKRSSRFLPKLCS